MTTQTPDSNPASLSFVPTITNEDRAAAKRQFPDIDDAGRAMLFGFQHPEASDGCTVYEPDGWCPHGRPSPYRVLGIV